MPTLRQAGTQVRIPRDADYCASGKYSTFSTTFQIRQGKQKLNAHTAPTPSPHLQPPGHALLPTLPHQLLPTPPHWLRRPLDARDPLSLPKGIGSHHPSHTPTNPPLVRIPNARHSRLFRLRIDGQERPYPRRSSHDPPPQSHQSHQARPLQRAQPNLQPPLIILGVLGTVGIQRPL